MKNKGFTLIEILVVIAIIGILSAIIYPPLINHFEKVKIDTTKILITGIDNALYDYSNSVDIKGYFPDETESEEGNGTEILVKELHKHNKFSFDEKNLTNEKPVQLVDAWGNPMRYRPWRGRKIKETAHNPRTYDLSSAGPDGFWDTEDDICNWNRKLDNEK